jgi:hypothetical protein
MRTLLAVVAVSVCACKAVYAPTLSTVPILRERGELRATIDPHNLQLAYAASHHIGLIADGFVRNETQKPDAGKTGDTDAGHARRRLVRPRATPAALGAARGIWRRGPGIVAP